jgi:hypothetical protein
VRWHHLEKLASRRLAEGGDHASPTPSSMLRKRLRQPSSLQIRSHVSKLGDSIAGPILGCYGHRMGRWAMVAVAAIVAAVSCGSDSSAASGEDPPASSQTPEPSPLVGTWERETH